MNKKNDTAQDATALSSGVRVGLQMWLFFLTCFIVLRYRVPLSVFLGAVGGLTCGFVVFWWKSKDLPLAQPVLPDAVVEDSIPRYRVNKKGLAKRKQIDRKSRPSLPLPAWLFGSKKQKASKSKGL